MSPPAFRHVSANWRCTPVEVGSTHVSKSNRLIFASEPNFSSPLCIPPQAQFPITTQCPLCSIHLRAFRAKSDRYLGTKTALHFRASSILTLFHLNCDHRSPISRLYRRLFGHSPRVCRTFTMHPCLTHLSTTSCRRPSLTPTFIALCSRLFSMYTHIRHYNHRKNASSAYRPP